MTPEEFNGDWQVATHAIRERDELRTELARERERLKLVRELAGQYSNISSNQVLAILDRKLDAGGSVAGQAEPLSGDPPANSDRSRT